MGKTAKILLPLIIPVLLLGFLNGCGKSGDDMVLAKVGSDEILVRDMNEIMGRANNNYLTFEDEFKHRRDILDSMVIQQLLIQEAYDKNIDDLEEVNRLVLGNKEKFLLDVLYQRAIEDNVNVTDKDIEDFYGKLDYRIKASHILLPSKDSADLILDSLQNGGNFEDLAVHFSKDPSAQQNRGDLGFFTWGQMVPEFQDVVFNMNPGDVSKPFETRYGWHIVKVVEREPNDLRGTLEESKDQIRTAIERVKRDSLTEDFKESLHEKFPIAVETSTTDYIIHKRDNLYPPQLLETLPKNDFDLAQLDRHEKELVLASWDGGQMTLGQYLTKIKNVRPELRPNLEDSAGIAELVLQLNIMEILAAEARRQGLEDDPEYRRKIKKFKELTMADVMANDSLPQPEPISDEDASKYYDEHVDEYLVPPQAHVYEILVSSKGDALELLKQVKSPRTFMELAAKKTERPGYRAKMGDLGYIKKGSYPALFDAAEKAAVGDFVGPVPMGNKYSILYVLDKKAEEVQDFDAVKKQIVREMESARKRELFENWVEQKKAKVNIKIYENNLRASIDKDKYEESKGKPETKDVG